MSFIKGEVSYKVYYNDQSSYGVYKVIIEETNEPYFDFQKSTTITGTFPPLEESGTYIFNGKLVFNQNMDILLWLRQLKEYFLNLLKD